MTIRLNTNTIKVGDIEINYVFPDGDNTHFGTQYCLLNNKYNFSKIEFKDRDNFIDFGCNIGLISLLIAKTYPNIIVSSFDLNPISILCLKISIELNKLRNINVYNFGIGVETKEDIVFSYNDTESSCCIREDYSISKYPNHFLARTVGIQEILESKILNFKKIKYLKMDIEGEEWPILNWLFLNKPELLKKIEYAHIELHSGIINDGVKNKDEVIAKAKLLWGDKLFLDT